MSGPPETPGEQPPRHGSLPMVCYASAALLGALLLFWVELFFARLLLPRFGGTAAVWTTSLLFFQLVLLLGYLYAHALDRRLSPRAGLVLHTLLLVAGGACLPVAAGASFFDPVDHPLLALLVVLTGSLGLPFLAVSTTAPLLQAWYSHLGRRDSANPYPLYAASNAGSLLALLAYPFLLEPGLGLSKQSLLWTGGYGLLALALVGCGAWVWRARDPAGGSKPSPCEPSPPPPTPSGPPTRRARLRWVLRSFAGACLLYGVTTTLTTDLTSTPLLWVIPLALYLVSFVLAFWTRRRLPREAVAIGLAPLLVVLTGTALIGLWQFPAPLVLIAAHVLGSFAAMLYLHRDLHDERPDAAHLTGFYVWIAVGGVLAGGFCALAAPSLFESLLEYPLALLLTCFLLHGDEPPPHPLLRKWLSRVLSLGIGMLTALLLAGFVGQGLLAQLPGYLLLLPLAAAVAAGFDWGKIRAFHLLSLGVLAGQCVITGQATLVHRERSFFGMHSVLEQNGFRHYVSGSTVHGRQSLDPARAREPAAYYARSAPMGQVFSALPPRPRRVAVLGLGIGGLAAHAKAGETWRFYEIDPAMVRLANDPSLFTYMRGLPAAHDVVVGDGRLALAAEANQPPWDVLVMDAFSSDAIPTHLLTVEAFGIYLRRLADDGLLVVNISNRSLELEPLLAALAFQHGLYGKAQRLVELSKAQRLEEGASRSHCVVLAHHPQRLDFLGADWHELAREGLPRPWTDDRIDLLSALSPR